MIKLYLLGIVFVYEIVLLVVLFVKDELLKVKIELLVRVIVIVEFKNFFVVLFKFILIFLIFFDVLLNSIKEK